MSVYMIYYKDGAKMMRPVLTREEYLALRNGGEQQSIIKAVRSGDETRKSKLVQMNYSCLPNDDGTLKGSTRMSTTVGMDIDHISREQMQPVMMRILSKKDELGLLLLEKSARGQGYHLVFKRKPELSQEENLHWASELLGVEFDKGAKDITRVFFTTTNEDLLFLEDGIFEIESGECRTESVECRTESVEFATALDSAQESAQKGSAEENSKLYTLNSKLAYNGIPYSDIIRKWWELYNEGKEPVRTNRDVLTFELAVNLRHICGLTVN